MFKYLKSFFVEEKKKVEPVIKEVSQKQKDQMKSYVQALKDKEIEETIKEIAIEI
tara:strand:+ start:2048 stop:2212 length:165 start_codon:yes stop_codon:yes gene_type:complete